MIINRRNLVASGALGAVGAAISAPALADAPDLATFARDLAALNRLRIRRADFAALVDFSVPSWRPRLHLVDLNKSRVSSFLVAHGRGSDPAHTGWLKSFSNDKGSNASSAGAYRTAERYQGVHGLSMRLLGLDAENSNAEARAIVIHAAWYVGDEMIGKFGKLGRSEGCFALAQSALQGVLDRLGEGSLLYAGKF